MSGSPERPATPVNFIAEIVDKDLGQGRFDGKVVTRFPPEPNGFLHIGHAFAINVSFGLAQKHGGQFHLRFDDTNPTKEDVRYVESQQRDIRWLGVDWGDNLFYASDYFGQMVEYAFQLIRAGKAYVCHLDAEEIRARRGNYTTPGTPSPYRDRPIDENVVEFQKMIDGGYAEGKAVLRAKIDLAHTNTLMRDPIMYRIHHAHHYRQGDKWCVYPMYDWAHCLEDSIEGVTYSLCSIEFVNNRPLYDWYLSQLGVHHPQQIEFAKMGISHTVMGKRKLLELVEEGRVSGWDDARMPTLAGLRRRGVTSAAMASFLSEIGVTKSPTFVDITLLEHHVRQDLNRHARRVMGVLDPLKLVVTTIPEGTVEWCSVENNPEDPESGRRDVAFTREIYVEREDVREEANRKWRRLAPGREVRLKGAYYVTLDEIVKDPDTGEIVELRCSHDPASKGGWTDDGRKVKGTLHWVSATHCVDAEVRLVDRLFNVWNPYEVEEGQTWKDNVNPDSMPVLTGCKLEASLGEAEAGMSFQFLRMGYFCVDSVDSAPGALVFNRTIALRDSSGVRK